MVAEEQLVPDSISAAVQNEPVSFMIVDGHALIYRAYHAFPGLTDPTGRLVNAVYGFTRILLTAIRDLKPEYLTVAFDSKGPTLRAQKYAQYKAQRAPMPDDLIPQIAVVKEIVDALNIPRYEQQGYEADDLIGTVSRLVSAGNGVTEGVSAPAGVRTIVVTGDKDLLQLVDDRVHVWLPGRGKGQLDEELNAEGVVRKLGVRPDQVVELKALMGDASDNIPGVAGVGPKTACQLIGRFETIDRLYATLAEIDGTDKKALKELGLSPSLYEKLIKDKENAFLSRELATIDRAVDVSFRLLPCKISSYNKEAVETLFRSLDFKSLLYLLPKDDFELGVQKALF